MTSLEKALNHLTNYVKKYRELSPDDGDGMVECLQQITPTLFYLEGERAKAHERYEGIVHKEVINGNSVARAMNLANVHVPEMYQLRKIIDSAYTTCEAIRSHLSWIKTEKHNSQ